MVVGIKGINPVTARIRLFRLSNPRPGAALIDADPGSCLQKDFFVDLFVQICTKGRYHYR